VNREWRKELEKNGDKGKGGLTGAWGFSKSNRRTGALRKRGGQVYDENRCGGRKVTLMNDGGERRVNQTKPLSTAKEDQERKGKLGNVHWGTLSI